MIDLWVVVKVINYVVDVKVKYFIMVSFIGVDVLDNIESSIKLYLVVKYMVD